MSTLLDLLDSGDHVVAARFYGGTFRLFERVRKRSAGLQFTFVDSRCGKYRSAVTSKDSDDLGWRLRRILCLSW